MFTKDIVRRLSQCPPVPWIVLFSSRVEVVEVVVSRWSPAPPPVHPLVCSYSDNKSWSLAGQTPRLIILITQHPGYSYKFRGEAGVFKEEFGLGDFFPIPPTHGEICGFFSY